MDNTKIKEKAYNLILIYDAKTFLNKYDLIQICNQNNWIVQSYEQGKYFLDSYGLKRFLSRESFYHFDKDTKVFHIFYNDCLSELEQMLSISHEIGHILLEHISYFPLGIIGIDNWKEQESEIFAYELLLPSIIIKKLKLRKKEVEKLFSLTPGWYAYVCQEISIKSNIDLKIEHKITELFQDYILKSKKLLFFEKFNKKILKFSIIFTFLICTIIFIISQQYFFTSNKQIYKNEPLNQQKNTTLEVVKTPTGERYHLPNCQYIKGKEILSMPIEKAIQMGYAPCRMCKPDKTLP